MREASEDVIGLDFPLLLEPPLVLEFWPGMMNALSLVDGFFEYVMY